MSKFDTLVNAQNIMLHNIGCPPGKNTIPPETLKYLMRHSKQFRIMFDDGYLSLYNFIKTENIYKPENIYSFPVVNRIGKCNDWDNDGELVHEKLMTWEQIEKLIKMGVRIGSHSLNHPDLRKLSNSNLKDELVNSKHILEDKLNIEVTGFAYPFGFHNQRVISAVQEAGYKWAVTTCDSILQGFGNPFRLRRIELKGTDPYWLIRLKILPFYDTKAIWELPKLLFDKITDKITM